jgi:alkylation response protein AidB-like acyl-CoA dehydrogenase
VILPAVTQGAVCQDRSVVVIVGGQIGAGKKRIADLVQAVLTAWAGPCTSAGTAQVRAETGYVTEKITRAIDILLSAHGAASFADVNPLQRIWRDSAVGARHAVVLPAAGYEVYGKALLGVEEKITPLI